MLVSTYFCSCSTGTKRRCDTSQPCHLLVPLSHNTDNFYAKYTDWIDEFISAFRTEKYIILTADREKVADNCQKLLRGINITIDRIIEEEHKPAEMLQSNVLPSFFPLWIIGRNQRTELLDPLDLSIGDTKI